MFFSDVDAVNRIRVQNYTKNSVGADILGKVNNINYIFCTI